MFTSCFLGQSKNQLFFVLLSQLAKRSTGDEFGFFAQHKINRVFEHSNNEDQSFKQLSFYLTHCGEDKALLPSVDGKNTLIRFQSVQKAWMASILILFMFLIIYTTYLLVFSQNLISIEQKRMCSCGRCRPPLTKKLPVSGVP